jgi:hypothetical protein
VSLQAYRGRLPTGVFILLALVCLGLLGFACACLMDQPMDAIAQTLAAIPLAPAVLELWPALIAALLAAAAVLLAARRLPAAARSPAALQRFLL